MEKYHSFNLVILVKKMIKTLMLRQSMVLKLLQRSENYRGKYFQHKLMFKIYLWNQKMVGYGKWSRKWWRKFNVFIKKRFYSGASANLTVRSLLLFDLLEPDYLVKTVLPLCRPFWATRQVFLNFFMEKLRWQKLTD